MAVTGAQTAGQVGGQPLHDDVVGPVHGEVGDVHRPQRPVRHKLAPPHVVVVHLLTKGFFPLLLLFSCSFAVISYS